MEYKIICSRGEGFWIQVRDQSDSSIKRLEEIINHGAEKGWEVHTITPVANGDLIVLMQRQVRAAVNTGGQESLDIEQLANQAANLIKRQIYL